MKHAIYRPIAIGALLALASLTAHAQEHKEAPATPTEQSVIKLSQVHNAALMLAA